MRLEYQDDIDRFLMNRMSDDERTAFESKCAENKELKEQFEHTRNVKAVIMSRRKMLEKIQGWDDDYDEEKRKAARRKKRLSTYWASGIAAAVVVGAFLYPSIKKPELGSIRNGIPNRDMTKLDEHAVSQADTLSLKEGTSKNLLAKSDAKNPVVENSTGPNGGEKVFSIGSNKLETPTPDGAEGLKRELKEIEVDLNALSEKITELKKQFYSEDISQEVYLSMVELLNYQKDILNWRRAQILLELNRKVSAMSILDEMRRTEGQYKSKADSLYKTMANHE